MTEETNAETIAAEFGGGTAIAEALAPEDKLKKLHSLALDAKQMEFSINEMELQLGAIKSALQEVRTKKMPELMTDLAMPDFTFEGWEYKLGDFVSGSFPKDFDKRNQAKLLLIEYDAEGMIKTEVTLPFGKSQYGEAFALYRILSLAGYTASMDESIHAQTYCAFARARLEEGEKIDIEGLGLLHGKVVKFKEAKEKKARKKKGEGL